MARKASHSAAGEPQVSPIWDWVGFSAPWLFFLPKMGEVVHTRRMREGSLPPQLCQSLIRDLANGVALLDSSGHVLFWNVEVAFITGLRQELAIGRSVWRVLAGLLSQQSLHDLAAIDWRLLQRDCLLQAKPIRQVLGFIELRHRRSGDGAGLSSVNLEVVLYPDGGECYVACLLSDRSEENRRSQSLRAAEQRLALLQANTGATWWELEVKTQRMRFGAAWAEQLGLRACEGCSYELDEVLERLTAASPSDRGLGNVLSEGPSEFELDLRYLDREGQVTWVECHGWLAERDSEARPARYLGTLSDISRRKELEESISEKNRILREVIDQSPQLISLRDAHGRYVLANERLAQFYGKSAEDIVGSSLEELHARGDERLRLMAEDRHVIETGETLIIPELRLCSPAGRVHSFELTLVPLELAGMRGRLALGFGVDISEQQAAELALHEERDRLSVTLRSLGEGVIATDLHGRITLMNPMACEICGYEEREALGYPVGQVFKLRYGPDAIRLDDPVRDIIERRSVVTRLNDTILERRNGQRLEIVDRGAPIIAENGQVSGAVLVFSDVSERRAMEREVAKIQKIESLGILAGGIAHDFNNILMAVLGNITMAKLNVIGDGQAQAPSETEQLLQEAEKAVLQAKRLTAQLSMMAKGGSEPVREAVNVEPILREALNLNLRASLVRGSLECPEKPWKLAADPAQLMQIFQNLVINAREALSDRGAAGLIEIKVFQERVEKSHHLPLSPGDYLRIEVRDNGPGMPPEIVQRVFDPYFTTKSRGSGLGLTITFSVVKKHGGYIDLRSRQGEGSVFSVYLPAIRE